MIAEDDDLSPQWALMRDFADEVNSTGYEYRPVSQNSNTFAGGALQRARLYGAGSPFPERFDTLPVFDPVSGQTTSRYVPGFEAPLRNPIDTEVPMPFPLDVRTGSPSDGPAVPDRRGSLDDGLQRWGLAAPAGSSADNGVRYLGRLTYGMSQRPKVESAGLFNLPAALMPNVGSAPPLAPLPSFQSSDDGEPLSLMEAYLQYRKRLQTMQ